MADQNRCPSSTSSLIFPSASQSFSTTLKSLRRSTLSIPNRLTSIKEDSRFVLRIAKTFGLPLMANERCGSWYIPPEKKKGSTYFKSTDGHMGQWSFSRRRLNLQVLTLVGKHGGCIIVDSTRRGKVMPDALSKTIPIWVAVFNRALFPHAVSLHHLQYPSDVIGKSEITQIESAIHDFVKDLWNLKLDLADLKTKVGKPIRISWITQDKPQPEVIPNGGEYNNILLCSASRRVKGAEMSEGGYIQGAGDDSEGWSMGLTPEIFWENEDAIFRTAEEDLPELITRLIGSPRAATTGEELVLIKPTRNLYICRRNTAVVKDGLYVINCSDLEDHSKESKRVLNLNCPEGKLGSRDLRQKLPNVKSFLETNKDDIVSRGLLITCSTGKDLTVGVALMVLCTMYTSTGCVVDLQNGLDVDKQLVRGRLAWITASKSDANPSRSTLQAVNAFLMKRP